MMFDFETDIGVASGIARLVPTSSEGGEWRAHTVFTNLEDLKGFAEKTGELRNREPNHGRWEEDRRKEREFEGREPVVVIVGGGHSGLDLAARLKCLDIPTLVVEKNSRIGDNWRNRYEALCLHDPVCEYTSIAISFFFFFFLNMVILGYDHMPYLPYVPFPFLPIFSFTKP